MGRYFGFRRRRKNKRNNNFNVILAIIAIMCAIALFKAIAEIIDYILLMLLIVMIPAALITVAVIIFCYQHSLIQKCDQYVLMNSFALEKIQEINSRYNFNQIDNGSFVHSYDNEKMYDDVSPKDYLIYQLVYCKRQMLSNISLAKDNNIMFSGYKREIEAVDDYGNFKTPASKDIVKYVLERERKLCRDKIKNPIVDFTITVKLNLTRMSGYNVTSKQNIFVSSQIQEIIDRLSQQFNGFYLDDEIWQAICRVERAKVSNKMRFAIYNRDGYRCRKCGSSDNLEIDHIYPISKGGKSEFNNLQTLCHNCNSKKSNTVESGVVNAHTNRTAYICPNCNVELVLRDGRLGKFYGCPNYPKCKFTKDI